MTPCTYWIRQSLVIDDLFVKRIIWTDDDKRRLHCANKSDPPCGVCPSCTKGEK